MQTSLERWDEASSEDTSETVRRSNGSVETLRTDLPSL